MRNETTGDCQSLAVKLAALGESAGYLDNEGQELTTLIEVISYMADQIADGLDRIDQGMRRAGL